MINANQKLSLLNLYPVAAVTSDGNSSAIDLGDYEGEIQIILDVSAPVAGSTPGLACKIQDCDTSGGSYADVTGGAFTAVASSASAQKIVLNSNSIQRYVKLNLDISGTSSPQYLVSAKILGNKKYE